MTTIKDLDEQLYSLSIHYVWSYHKERGELCLPTWFKEELEELNVKRAIIGHEIGSNVGEHYQCALWCKKPDDPKKTARKMREKIQKRYKPIFNENQSVANRALTPLGKDEVATFKRRVHLTPGRKDSLPAYCQKDNNVLWYGAWTDSLKEMLPKWIPKRQYKEMTRYNFNNALNRELSKKPEPPNFQAFWRKVIQFTCGTHKRPKPTITSVLALGYRHGYLTPDDLIMWDCGADRADLLLRTKSNHHIDTLTLSICQHQDDAQALLSPESPGEYEFASDSDDCESL